MFHDEIERDLERREDYAREEFSRIRANVRACFGGDSGAEVLRQMQHEFHCHKSTFVAGDSDATAFNEGQRSVVLWILSMMQGE